MNNQRLVRELGIDGYPTLVVYRAGQRLPDYEGHRTAKYELICEYHNFDDISFVFRSLHVSYFVYDIFGPKHSIIFLIYFIYAGISWTF